MRKNKSQKNIFIIIGIIFLVLAVFVGWLFLSSGSKGAKIGEPCGFDFQFCESELFCNVAGISESTGNQFGACSEVPNYLGEIEACGIKVLACCGEGLVCATQPDGNSYCFKESDNSYLNYPIIDKKCY
mgnify:CR=1 FL=1